MRRSLSAFAAGALFAVGLGASGMTLPEKVIGFLNVTGDWDPSLAFVMLGALSVHFIALRLILRRAAPIYGATFPAPVPRSIDSRLVLGAAVFGLGWGIAGYCPGPAIVSLATLTAAPLTFGGAMAAGMLLQHMTQKPSNAEFGGPRSVDGDGSERHHDELF